MFLIRAHAGERPVNLIQIVIFTKQRVQGKEALEGL